MSTTAIKRIKGYCTEVTQAQWEEWKSVCKDFGIDPLGKTWDEYWRFCFVNNCNELERIASEEAASHHNITIIPFPDFLAKLRGVEKWTLKAGEMVEVSIGGENWVAREFIGERKELYWAWYEDRPNSYSHCRPLSPTITRAEAEAQLGKRIID